MWNVAVLFDVLFAPRNLRTPPPPPDSSTGAGKRQLLLLSLYGRGKQGTISEFIQETVLTDRAS